MKRLLFLLAMIGLATSSWARGRSYEDNSRPHKDVWGNSYKHRDNLYKDTDGDGVINKYDYNDRNPNIQRKRQVDPYNPYGNN